MIGSVKGSIGVVSVVASALFGAISGSAVATVSAIGGTTIPAMKEEGYPDHFAAALVSMASILGPLIPPSIGLIVYGSLTDTSISKLFKATIIPGLLLALILIGYALIFGKKHNLPAQEKLPAKEIFRTFKESIWALLMPLIILGGIFGGVFTATEASVVAVVYSLLISVFVYKDTSRNDLFKLFVESAISTSIILMLVGLSKSSSYVVVTSRLPQIALDFITSITSNKIIMLMIINVLFLVIGMLMEGNAAIVMMTPLLLPMVQAFGVDVIQFGMIMTLNLYIGLMTPPVGVSLLLGCTIAESKFSETLRTVMPLLILGMVLLIAVTYIPALTMWLPTIL